MITLSLPAQANSGAAAVAQALSGAMSNHGDGAKYVHIVVTSVFETDGVWNAVVMVVIEPNLDKNKDNELEHDHEKDAEKPNELNANQGHEEKNALEKLIDQTDFIDNLDAMFPEIDGVTRYVYFPSKHEDIYDDFMTLKPDVRTQLLEDGPLWNNVQNYLLDVEFFKAVNASELAKRSEADSNKLENHIKDLKPQQRLKLLQHLELID